MEHYSRVVGSQFAENEGIPSKKMKEDHTGLLGGLALGRASVPLNRKIDVCASGTVTLQPDRAKVDFHVSTKEGKDTVEEAKTSVSRRADYIFQTLHTHNVKEGYVTSTSSLTRTETLFHMLTQITVVFVGFGKCQSVCNLLVEKLDDSVEITQPHFYYAAQTLDNVRRQACMQATRNAYQKASEMACYLYQTLGAPFVITEEETKEWEGPPTSHDTSSNNHEGSLTFQQRLAIATVHVSSKVYASFELVVAEKS